MNPSLRWMCSPRKRCVANFWNSGWNTKFPTRAIFIVTHNIEEAIVLADRIIVLGRNPAHIHADFTVTMPYPRDPQKAGIYFPR